MSAKAIRTASIVLVTRSLATDELPRLYRAADAFVLPSRGEGWGRPYMESLAMELPVIASRAGGALEFLHDGNALLVDGEPAEVDERAAAENPLWAGHRWFEPSEAALGRAMRHVVERPSEARARARLGRRELAARFDRAHIGRTLRDRLEAVRERVLASR